MTFDLPIQQSRVVAQTEAPAPGHDPALVVAAQRGDRQAFGLLYERYGAMVHGVLLARVPIDAVDDLVQDVFLSAFQHLGSLRQPEAFGGWLAAIARRRAVDHYRQTRVTVDATDLPAVDHAPRAEALEVLAVIRSLPDTYRETLMLRLVEGMTGREIADRTGLTPASVRVNLHRGMKQLRERLGETQERA